MLARWLRWGVLAQILGAAVFALSLIRYAGIGLTLAAALAIAALLGLYLFFTLATFAVCWPRKGEAIPGQAIGLGGALLLVLGEWLAFFALFAVIQPFASAFFPVRARQRSKERPPVILVHGYNCNEGLWWLIRLRSKGLAVETMDLEPPFASIDTFADHLHRRIESCLRDAGAAQVQLVTHSMGGLAARAYLKRYGGGRVQKLVTLACPHHGTRLARLGLGQNAREMELGSAWLAGLPEPVPVPTVNIWSAHDNFVGPQTSARLAGAKDIMLTGIGHLSFLFSRRVLSILAKELA